MSKTHTEWLAQLTNPELPLVLAVGGDERAYVDEAVDAIKKRVLNHTMVDFNFDVLSAKTMSFDDIVLTAKMLPVLADKRLVIVTESEALKGDEFALPHNPTTVLLFVFDILDTRLKFAKTLDLLGVLYKFDHPKEREMLSLIQARAKERGFHMSQEVVQALYFEIGNNVLLLERAFEKLELSVEGVSVTVQDIGEQIAQAAFQDAFKLARAVVLGEKAEVARSLCELRKAQEVPLKLLGLLAWQFRIVLKVRAMLDEHCSVSEIGSKLNLFGDRLDTALKAAKIFSAEEHIQRLKKLYEVDKKLKSSRVPAWLLLEEAVLT